MLTKEEVLNMVNGMPSIFTFAEITDKLLLLDKINIAIGQSKNGETVSTEEARRLLLDSFPDSSFQLNKTTAEYKWELYNIALRFLPFKVTPNLRRVYLDINIEKREAKLIAYYEMAPSEIELELLDDIETNSCAHTPDSYFTSEHRLYSSHIYGETHDFIVFAVFEPYGDE
ncbi:hypothetical protein [Mucilaginibacter psychrotolerans]|uniref:Uncharacterized protein n=1 Tax=Mucilaginibacter psychrotolerans TaxID=1524096 RepID=A0A4Y8S4E8_9SPHI|nr:hypothetical protein [Mucilaginibacter psychrotolerans]TFF33294.1 hypothetical protein E2R66_26505 [Mucilaginibacter psychrotolerans]